MIFEPRAKHYSLLRGIAASALVACAAQESPPIPERATRTLSDAEQFVDRREAADSSIDFTQYLPLRLSDTRKLELRRVREIRLGTTPAEYPSQVSDVVFRGTQTVVLDGAARKLRAYDAEGRPVYSVGKWGEHAGEMSSPRRIALEGETLILLDATHSDAFSAYNVHGDYIGPQAPNLFDGGNVAFARNGDTLYVAGLPVDSEARNPFLVRVLDRSGKLLARGCRRSPEYSRSEARNGLIHAYGFADVSIAGIRVYCIQPISPIVQVLTLSGRLAETIRLAPPFYVPPSDIAATTNGKAMQAFEGTFTAHTRVFATRSGFISVYERVDSTTHDSNYRLFRCEREGSSRQRCAMAASPGKPIRLIAPDTLVILEAATEAVGPRLGLYQVR